MICKACRGMTDKEREKQRIRLERYIIEDERMEKWHKFFAVFPRYVGSGRYAFLQFVEEKRRTVPCFTEPKEFWGTKRWVFEYRLMDGEFVEGA